MEIFNTGFSSLFNEPETNCGTFGETAVVDFKELPLIKLGIPDCKDSNVYLFAHHIWKSSVLLSKLLIQNPNLVSGKDCLEFGAGCGLPSIVANKLGAKSIVASDYPDANIIEMLHSNLTNNCTNNFKAIGHAWGNRGEDDLFPQSGTILRFDTILMADTLWMSDQHLNLWSDLSHLIKPNGTVIIVAGLHSGRNILESFIAMAPSSFELSTKVCYLIPIGNGFGENQDWIPVVDNVNDSKNERNRFLYHIKFTAQQTGMD